MKRANAGMKDSSATSIIIGAAQATMPATNIATRRRSPVAASGTLRNIRAYAGICRRMRTVQKTEPSRGILESGRSCAARSAEMRSRSGDCSRRLLAARTHATASEIVMPARIRRCNPGAPSTRGKSLTKRQNTNGTKASGCRMASVAASDATGPVAAAAAATSRRSENEAPRRTNNDPRCLGRTSVRPPAISSRPAELKTITWTACTHGGNAPG